MRVSYSGIKETIKHLEDIRKKLGEDKLHSALQKIVEEGYEIASARFADAIYAGTNDVNVEIVWDNENTVSLVANGQSVLFIEFGSGITWPESPYTEFFPEVVPHGEWGDKKGQNPKGWIYRGEQGNGGLAVPVVEHRKNGTDIVKDGVWRTWGNPPARAMYNASKTMHARIEEILREMME